MHGCGHDGHTAMLVGAARYLAETRRFDGTGRAVFQPGKRASRAPGVDDGRWSFDRFPVQSICDAQLVATMKPWDRRFQRWPL